MTSCSLSGPIPVTPIPPEVDDARRILAAVLAADLTFTDALTISEALDRLLDVHPPYPPPGRLDPPTRPDVGIPRVITALGEAVTATTSIHDLYRYGETLVLVRDVLDGGALREGVAP
jgi:hypothetical protein